MSYTELHEVTLHPSLVHHLGIYLLLDGLDNPDKAMPGPCDGQEQDAGE
jgi:hypothetical protein